MILFIKVRLITIWVFAFKELEFVIFINNLKTVYEDWFARLISSRKLLHWTALDETDYGFMFRPCLRCPVHRPSNKLEEQCGGGRPTKRPMTEWQRYTLSANSRILSRTVVWGFGRTLCQCLFTIDDKNSTNEDSLRGDFLHAFHLGLDTYKLSPMIIIPQIRMHLSLTAHWMLFTAFLQTAVAGL